MKRYCEIDSISNVAECTHKDCPGTHYVELRDVQALAKEVLPFIPEGLAPIREGDEQVAAFNDLRSRLQKIIEATP